MNCPKCNSEHWDNANIGIEYAVQCTDCGYIYPVINKKPWVELTKGQIDYATRQADNYDFAWEIESICKANNGY